MSVREPKRYDVYIDSGVEWLGDVPSSWRLKRHKDNFFLITDRAVNVSLRKVALESIEGKTGRFLNTRSEFDGDGVKFRKNDILFGKLRPYLAKVYLAEFNGSSVGDIFVYRPARNIYPRFALYLMLSDRYIDVINSSTFGAKMPRVSSAFIAKLPIATPPIVEQKAIANYLDTKTAQIDRKIELLTKKATKYGELKQSLINETVTHGLDKTVAMKDSGVEWIGEVPEHWEIKRVKDISRIVNGSTPKSGVSDNWDGEIPWVTTDDLGKLHSKFITDSKRKLSEKGYRSCGTTICPIGSVVLSGRAPIGHIGILSIEACTNQGCKTLVLDNKLVHNTFAFYSLLSAKSKLEALGRGTTFIELSTKGLSLFSVPTPQIEEQLEIIHYLDRKTAQMDNIIETINTQIDKLRELRKTLINEVVTGKIKVV